MSIRAPRRRSADVMEGVALHSSRTRNLRRVDWMRFLVVGLAALMLVSGCAALRKTEDLPSPSEQLGGPEGEEDAGAL